MGFFDADAVGQRIFYEDLGGALIKEGVPAALERVKEIVNQRDPGLLVIDSFKPLAAVADSGSEYRRFLHELAARLSIRPITSLWLGEYTVNDMRAHPSSRSPTP